LKKKSILFIYVSFQSFVRTDYEILSSEFDVRKYQFKPVKGILNTGIELVKQFIFLLINIWKYDSIYIWFADYHSLLPVILARISGKKSYVVIGGYEVCRMKQIGYGALCSKFRGFFCIKTMKMSTLNFTVSKYVDRKVKYIAPGSRRELIPNCVDFIQSTNKKAVREDIILTVGLIETQRSFFLKGIDTFIEIARLLPDYQFIIIGLDKVKLNFLVSSIPENITIIGKLPHEELPEYYMKARFYCQLSRSESFGVSIAESMFYGCFPIVTHEGGMPELVGDAGYIVPRKLIFISEMIKKSMKKEHEIQAEAKARFVENYSRARRKDLLMNRMSIK
jgi:glycosyltransferase involved in cell wall biosynthesis